MMEVLSERVRPVNLPFTALDILDSCFWLDLVETFQKNLLPHAGDGRVPIGQVVGQLSAFYDGLDSIKEVLAAGIKARAIDSPPPSAPQTIRPL